MVPTVTRRPRMHGFPPMTAGLWVIRSICMRRLLRSSLQVCATIASRTESARQYSMPSLLAASMSNYFAPGTRRPPRLLELKRRESDEERDQPDEEAVEEGFAPGDHWYNSASFF